MIRSHWSTLSWAGLVVVSATACSPADIPSSSRERTVAPAGSREAGDISAPARTFQIPSLEVDDEEEMLYDEDGLRTDANGTGAVVVTEILYDPSTSNDTDGEWFELFNPSPITAINLKNWTVKDVNTVPDAFTISAGVDFYIQPHQYMVFATQSTLGVPAYGITADYVYPSVTAPKMQLANAKDTIRINTDTGTLVTDITYNEAAPDNWPNAVNASIVLGSALTRESYVEAGKSYWCISITTITGGTDKGTPKRPNDSCANVDTDRDGLEGTDDTNPAVPGCETGNVETVGDGIDNDCDSIELVQYASDSSSDSAASNTELTTFNVGWSTNALAFSFDYKIQDHAILWAFDTATGGETNFLGSSGYAGAFPTNFQSSASIDFMAASYGGGPLYVYRVADNSSTDITSTMEASYRTSYVNSSNFTGVGFVRVDFNTLYGLGAGKVPVGAVIKAIGVVRAGDNTNVDDFAPNNSAQPATTYHTLYLDANYDGLADNNAFVDTDGDTFRPVDGDCDDANAAVKPGATEVCNELDDDCDGLEDEGFPTTDTDGDGIKDCADTETCDGLDNDGDGQIDEGLLTTYYQDTDGDGFGKASVSQEACSVPNGYVGNNTDCDDADDEKYPGNAEVCDGKDNDCDSSIDEGLTATFYQDQDGDGFGNTNVSQVACGAPSGYVADNTDCNDNDAANYPGNTEVCDTKDNDCDSQIDENLTGTYYQDQDEDGYGNAGVSQVACGAPSGYVANSTDCDDGDAQKYPGNTEVCDTKDNDCDTQVDEGVKTTFYADADHDTYGHAGTSVSACAAPTDYVTDNTDCDDGDPDKNPGETEICDGKDNDCDSSIDEGVKTTYYRDADSDTFGNASVTTQACSAPSGYVANSTDCDDTSSAIKPGATEVCDSKDNDCDAQIDEGVKTTYYQDADTDTYGNTSVTIQACSAPGGYVTNSTDCDDTNSSIKPGATEVCNSKDDDCDSQVDEGVKITYYQDADGDTYGNTAVSTQACSPPSGYVANSTDCDDTNGAIKPGGTETCNGKDDDCDTQIDEGVKNTYYADNDGDTYGNSAVSTQACTPPSGYVTNSTDCDDTSGSIKPGATEVCNGKDDDCDTQVDESVKTTYYQDLDGDTYGNPNVSTQTCTPPSGYVLNSSDCDDTSSAIKPGATEICDGKDNNCDGSIDPSTSSGAPTWYKDADSDNYGTSSNSQVACNKPTGFVSTSGDCNDGDAAINPAATETCDGKDNNCDGSIDPSTSQGAATWYADSDTDSFGNSAVSQKACNKPSGYVSNNTDCNDNSSSIYPGAPERCDGVDEDCDGQIDDNPTNPSTWYIDFDADGYGASSSFDTTTCNKPVGYVSNNTDCNNSDNTVYPGAPEKCDTKDNDCDGSVDETGAVDAATWYADNDSDGYGNAASTKAACTKPSGYVSDKTDCDDTMSSVHPGATEICDGFDNNCDAKGDVVVFDVDKDNHLSASQGCPATVSGKSADDCNDGDDTIYPGAPLLCDGKDNDCDGLKDKSEGFDDDGDDHLDASACGTLGDDCNDSDATSYTGAGEICDGKDNDCDGSIADEQLDTDGDGYKACPPQGQQADCNDNANTIYPGATEICDGLDSNCDGQIPNNEKDVDNDGYPACPLPGKAADCDDTDPVRSPDGTETCDLKDNDCDGTIDDGVTTTFYADDDNDGAGDPATSTQACTQPDGYVRNTSDCDDNNDNKFGGNTESCDTIDNNCNGSVDEGFDDDAIGGPDCSDFDGDGFSEDQGDCDDADKKTYPGANEDPVGTGAGDDIDNNCNGDVDEGTLRFDDDEDGYCESGSCVGGGPAGDCNDANPDISPAAAEIPGNTVDENCDGGGSDVDGDGYSVGAGDCNDTNPDINPGVTDVGGNQVDENCDGTPNDVDGDSFDAVANGGGDCNDKDPAINPAATEIAGNSVDEDCSGSADDLDNDGYFAGENSDQDCDDSDPAINPAAEEIAYDGDDQNCDGLDLADVDGDGVCAAGLPAYDYNNADCPGGKDDCDDEDANISPDVDDIPGNNIDENCDGELRDEDGDGFDAGLTAEDDCDDQDADINPGVEEVPYDGLDQDCDGYDQADVDGDGYCASLSSYDYDDADCQLGTGDCDDNNADINPGAEDVAGNTVDEDCDGEIYDQDDDGYGLGEGDCNDTNPVILPGGDEICGNGIDEDCNLVDATCSDADNDGYTEADGDCDDEDPDLHPDAAEVCSDNIDNNCNGAIDESCQQEVASFGACSTSGESDPSQSFWGLLVLAGPLMGRVVRRRRMLAGVKAA